MKLAAVAVTLAVALGSAGCTRLVEIRTDHSAVVMPTASLPKLEADRVEIARLRECSPGHPAPNEVRNSIEDYGDYLVGFVEFDDQGWRYGKGEQMLALLARMRSDLGDTQKYPDYGFVSLVFVHGWHHNAHDNDCNVNEFRAMVRLASDRLNGADAQGRRPTHRQRVIGIYVGWRGEALDAPLLRYASIFDRRFAAEHVAKGAVRELFAELRSLQYKHPRNKTIANSESRIRTIVVGHSFGGLIAYHSVAQSMLNDLVLARPDPAPPCGPVAAPRPWPDQVVLINPAFEASRFEAIHNVAMQYSGCAVKGKEERPNLMVLTAKNDGATGTIFPMFRFVSTVFEKYASGATRDDERYANLHAIGFVDRYQTHSLCYKDEHVVLAAKPDAGPHSPVWVVTATPDIIDGHDGFLYLRNDTKPNPRLLNWLLDVYVNRGSELGQCNS